MDQTILLIILIVAIVAIMGFIVFVITGKSHPKHPHRIGPYRIIKELPPGGMSRIFLGKWMDDAEIIIKIPLESNPKEDSLLKFLEEGKILSKLKHPHIVGLQEYGKIELGSLQTAFIALEYVEGHNLAKLLKGGKKFSPNEASCIISSIASALTEAHNSKIYHRDISTNNIIINYEGSTLKDVKLIDFGIAKWQSGNEHTQRDMMKEHYASPEQIAREELDGRSDIYSLGIVYSELISGRRPFNDWDRKKPPATPIKLGLNVPEQIDNLIMQMLEFDKKKRIQNASKVIQINGVSPLNGKIYVAESRTGSQKIDIKEKSIDFLFRNKNALVAVSVAGFVVILAVSIIQGFILNSNTTRPSPPLEEPGKFPNPKSATLPDHFVLVCTKCNRIYEKEDYKFCLKDGAQLQRISASIQMKKY